ncbi:MAG: ABC transporter ATP-binding protein [Planctomycetota bacterium]|nr:ABC transporter ATP-binding protein [Planctomycetota bacterium]MDA0932495.1 ABC transporter ATP-binding protein [Planctomycetota bacterium]MDA1220687.1 ABC transporter ATP-binding protein [Planctomycetota bacterium]
MSSPNSASPAVRVADVSRSFGPVHAVAPTSFELGAGSFTALVGPSGCGKTTLLRILGGLEQPDRGRVERNAGGIGFCFQEPRLLGWRSVLDNVALPLELRDVPREERHARAADALRWVQLDEAADRHPHQLSGGMKMRAALARALVADPGLLLLDEPFGALDEVTRHELDEALRRLFEERRVTTVLVTHSLPEAVFLAERVLVFSPRPARIVADLETPAGSRGPSSFTDPAFNDVVRAASEALYGAIAEARR